MFQIVLNVFRGVVPINHKQEFEFCFITFLFCQVIGFIESNLNMNNLKQYFQEQNIYAIYEISHFMKSIKKVFGPNI